MYERVLIAVDDSSVSDQSLVHGLALVQDQHAVGRVVHVVDTVPAVSGDVHVDFDAFRESRIQAGREVIVHVAALVQSAGAEVVPELVEAEEQPLGDAIAAEALRWSADLIVIGTHGRGGLRHLLMGSVAEGVVRRANCPVLLVRGSSSA